MNAFGKINIQSEETRRKCEKFFNKTTVFRLVACSYFSPCAPCIPNFLEKINFITVMIDVILIYI